MSRKISHYELREELGQGGMGRVYKAYDTNLDRTIVLKLLAPELMSEEESRKRFLREARLASALDHANICTIYEIAEVDNQYFIAMQLAPGTSDPADVLDALAKLFQLHPAFHPRAYVDFHVERARYELGGRAKRFWRKHHLGKVQSQELVGTIFVGHG